MIKNLFGLKKSDDKNNMSNKPKAKSDLHQAQETLLHNESVIRRVPITDNYEKCQGDMVLGSGVNGNVVKLINKATGKVVAMKQIASNQKSAREVTLHFIAQQNCEFITKIDGLYLNRNQGKDYGEGGLKCEKMKKIKKSVKIHDFSLF